LTSGVRSKTGSLLRAVGRAFGDQKKDRSSDGKPEAATAVVVAPDDGHEDA